MEPTELKFTSSVGEKSYTYGEVHHVQVAAIGASFGRLLLSDRKHSMATAGSTAFRWT
jgi:hypothetical protein